MKFCPVVPEISRGQVHGPRKERRKRRKRKRIIIITRYDYNQVEISYINVDNFYMDNDRDIQFDIVIGHH
jgi:hypothetical protein